MKTSRFKDRDHRGCLRVQNYEESFAHFLIAAEECDDIGQLWLV